MCKIQVSKLDSAFLLFYNLKYSKHIILNYHKKLLNLDHTILFQGCGKIVQSIKKKQINGT